MKRLTVALPIAMTVFIAAIAQRASSEPLVTGSGLPVDTVYVALGIAVLAIAVASSSGTD